MRMTGSSVVHCIRHMAADIGRPFIVASRPRQDVAKRAKRFEHVENGPRQHHDVVAIAEENAHGRGDADAAKERHQIPTRDPAPLHELAQGELEEEDRNAAEEAHEQVGDEEGAAAILIRQVREAPHIAQTDGEADNGEDEFGFAAPLLTLDLIACFWVGLLFCKDYKSELNK